MEKLYHNKETIRVLDMPVDNITYEDCLNDLDKAVLENKQMSVPSMNVQIMYLSTKEKYAQAKSVFDKSTHRIPDGYGVIKAAKWFGGYDLPKTAGVDLIDKVFAKANEKGYSVFLYGTKEDVLERCIERLAKEFPNVKVVGHLNGFTDKSWVEIRDIINEVKPNITIVATGFPIQEEFMTDEIESLETNFVGAFGGTLDMFVGEQVRASQWWRDHKLEWLYRIVNLKRPERLLQIPPFLYKAWRSERKTKNIAMVVKKDLEQTL